eukprot:387588-Pelagomonas_calceolata.AAC.5
MVPALAKPTQRSLACLCAPGPNDNHRLVEAAALSTANAAKRQSFGKRSLAKQRHFSRRCGCKPPKQIGQQATRERLYRSYAIALHGQIQACVPLAAAAPVDRAVRPD